MIKKSIIYFFALVAIWEQANAQTYGCTDPLASNYNNAATHNNGTCLYTDASVSPTVSYPLQNTLVETSGLAMWNGKIWTHNDNTNINLYTLDTTNGQIANIYSLVGTSNNDWEEISQDSNYFYIGDFGNNASGNRTNLKILRVAKASLSLAVPTVDTISFAYADQTDFTAVGNNKTDFDCEAFIVAQDSIYLFTKQWTSNQSRMYALPKTPGTYKAQPGAILNVQGLVTGASYLSQKKIIALSGYSTALQPFVYLMYDFTGNNFVSGNKRKINVSLPFHQIEGICSSNGLRYYVSNEAFARGPLNYPQKLHVLDLSTFLQNYLGLNPTKTTGAEISAQVSIFPNPSYDFVEIKSAKWPLSYTVGNAQGKILLMGSISQGHERIDIRELPVGTYMLQFGNVTQTIIKK